MAELPRTCDFLVIGAGIAGVSVALQLSARGASVCVIEATQVCGGSSALNAGGVRQQFSLPVNITLARRTVGLLTEMTERGVDLGYYQVGYLFMISDEKAIPALQSAIQTQNRLDVPSRWLSVDETIGVVPGVNPAGLVGATFCPTDGYVDANTLVTTVAADARAAGTVIATGTAVTGFLHADDRITGVELSTGQAVAAGTVVNCAGAWADGIAGLYGASLRIRPWRSQLYVIEGAAGIPPDCPYTIDFNNGKTFYHGEQGTSVIAGTDADNACETSWRVPFDQAKTELLIDRLTSRFNSFDYASVRSGWAGLLEITADENPISDWTHFANMYTMAGFSGHGLPIAPGLAEQVAELLTGGVPSVDLSPYRADRFNDSSRTGPVEAMSMR